MGTIGSSNLERPTPRSSYTIDENDPVIYQPKLESSPQCRQQFFQSSPLSNDRHKLVVTSHMCDDYACDPLLLDYFVVESGAMVSSTNPMETSSTSSSMSSTSSMAISSTSSSMSSTTVISSSLISIILSTSTTYESNGTIVRDDFYTPVYKSNITWKFGAESSYFDRHSCWIHYRRSYWHCLCLHHYILLATPSKETGIKYECDFYLYVFLGMFQLL
jgi:hypothetical protein